jgi:glycosyltransferase involved in cell wall biosynthesis
MPPEGANSPASSTHPPRRATFVVPWYGEKIPGGAEAETRRTAQNLAGAGVEVTVLATCLSGLGSDWDHDHYPPGESVEDGVRVIRFPSATRDGARFNALNTRICGGKRISASEEQTFFANMVYSPELFAYLAAHPEMGPFFFIPYLFTTAAWGPLVHPEKSVIIPCLHDEGYARLISVRHAFESARAVVFHVPAERDLAASLYDLTKTEPLVLGEGVDAEWSADAERFRRKYKIKGPFILYAGRKDAGKNVPLLSRYFTRFLADGLGPQDLKLYMIGNLPAPIPPGAEKDIIDLGFVSKQDKYDAYAAADVLIQPSVMESFSLVIMEAWLAGTPVMVHAGCAVTKEHVELSGGGLHFGDYPRFAEGLRILLERPELREKMAQAGREYVLNNFSWPVVTQRFVELIDRLSAEPTPAPKEPPRDFAPPAGLEPPAAKERRRTPPQPTAAPQGETSPTPARPGQPAMHQMLADFSYGDAIGNDVLAIQKALRSRGFASDIFAEHVHPKLRHKCRPWQEYAAGARAQDVLIFHFSIGHGLAELLPTLPGRKVLRYHNITPAEFLEELSPDAARRSRLGRRQLPALAQAVELGLGVSDYNCAELNEAGCPATVAVPILLDLDQLEAAPDPAVLSRFKERGPNILHVGRIAPNKRIEDLIKTHYWLTKLMPGARLLLVGGGMDMPYGLGLRELVTELNVPGVHFAGHVSDAQLMAYYRVGHLYLCQSEHEGFCVPLVESMHFGMPIVAYASTGVPGTLDSGGVLLQNKDHVRTAELCARILGDEGLRSALGARARARLERFRPERVAKEFMMVLADRLGLEPPQ